MHLFQIHKQWTKRQQGDLANLSKAVEAVASERMTVRSASEMYMISKSTISRHVTAHRKSGNSAFEYTTKIDHARVFTDEEETVLCQHIDIVAKMEEGVTRMKIRKMAFEHAQNLGKNIPPNWLEESKAGEGWVRLFMSRNKLARKRPT